MLIFKWELEFLFFHEAIQFLNSTNLSYMVGEAEEIQKLISLREDLNAHVFILSFILTAGTLFRNHFIFKDLSWSFGKHINFSFFFGTMHNLMLIVTFLTLSTSRSGTEYKQLGYPANVIVFCTGILLIPVFYLEFPFPLNF